MDIEEIKNNVLKKIHPSKKEREKVREFIRDLITTAEVKSGKDAVVVGSIGKQDWISGDHDIDLFIKFPKSYKRKKLEDEGLKYGKIITQELEGEWEINFAEHPYVKAEINEFDVDIVPCYRIKKGGKIKSAVDRSPLHLSYVLDKLDPGLRNEVRLLKQFMKGIDVYGSDAKTQGFSGYLSELLVIKYGKFENILKHAKKWKPTVVIDPQNYTKKKENLIKKFPTKSLIILDPTDRDRNAAAVVSAENLIKFIRESQEFLKNPSTSFFETNHREKLTKKEIEQLKDRETKFIAVKMKKPDIIEDNLFPQLRKLKKRILQLLENHEFKVIRNYVIDCGKQVYILFEMETWYLPKIEKMTGPLISTKKHTQQFLSKYQEPLFGPYIENDKWVVERERKFQHADKLILDFLFTEKSRMQEVGIPKNLIDVVPKAQVLEHGEFWENIEENELLSQRLKNKYFEKLRI